MEGYGLRLNKRIGEPEGTKEENKALGFLIFSHLFARNPLSYPPFTPFTLVQQFPFFFMRLLFRRKCDG